MDADQIARELKAASDFMQAVGLQGPEGQTDGRRTKKLDEVAGFIEHILKALDVTFSEVERPVILECSCGKSYLCFALNYMLRAKLGQEAEFLGVDFNPRLIERCREIAGRLAFDNMSFTACRSLSFEPDRRVDLLLALHACDTATDEAIALAIRLGCRRVMAVPCCQNQIRGQLKGGHPLTGLTDFGPLLYRFSNLLTDGLRAQFLWGAGYAVEFQEITSPRVTPKNLMISGRRVKRRVAPRFENYVRLRDMFGVHPRIEDFSPVTLVKDPGRE
ncbi:MAG TPA: SAM-dependent methyltransferase [Candidatus Brocadiia bacterium]|nr:SAM-dependent methyltransferase [Candidatus Brocadiia bacterium]